MTRVMILLVILLSSFVPVSAQDAVVVGVEPEMYDTVVAGVQGWNAAGVGFVVEATGCGTGDVTFCYSADPWSFGFTEQNTAWYVIGGNTIYISTVTPYAFIPETACHELGHWLGLHYHREETTTCMNTVAANGPASPDDTDLANLGLSWVAVPEPEPTLETQAEPETVVTTLPKTGHGPTRNGSTDD